VLPDIVTLASLVCVAETLLDTDTRLGEREVVTVAVLVALAVALRLAVREPVADGVTDRDGVCVTLGLFVCVGVRDGDTLRVALGQAPTDPTCPVHEQPESIYMQ
jgi:hypothetical protein